MHWAGQHIGTPYSDTGTGPDSYHCWAFFRMVQRVQFGRQVGDIANPLDLRAQVLAFGDRAELARWQTVPLHHAVEGDGVLLRRARYPIHVGIWVTPPDGAGVLHCVRGAGAVYQRPAMLAADGWSIHGVYRYIGDCRDADSGDAQGGRAVGCGGAGCQCV